MDHHQLLGYYTSRPVVVSISTRIQEEETHHLHLKGLAGSSAAVLLGAICSLAKRTHVVILSDREEAAYFLNDVENVLDNQLPLFFPSSYKKTFQFDEADSAHILSRAEVLSRLSRSTPVIVVTYPEAIAEKVVTRKNLELNSIALRIGEKLSTDFINEFLLHHEFENVDFVAQAGEFSVRGGIIDIFSFANELPYRIEFSGDEVESIRTFDPATQLSVQAMNHITIMPNVQKKLLEDSRTSFFDFIPADTVIWTNDFSATLDYLKLNLDKARTFVDENKSYSSSKVDEIFDTAEFILQKLNEKTTVEFSKRHYFSNGEEVLFSISPQPSFNKNFDLLIKNFQQNQLQKIENLIFADSAKQVERLYAIFDDLERKILQTEK